MDLDLDPDLQLLAQSLDRWVQDHMQIPADRQADTHLPGTELADQLAEQGYLDLAREAAFGPLGGVLLVQAAARTPWALEVGASGLVAPMLGLSDLPRPLALTDLAHPVARHLHGDGAALIDAGDHVRLLACGGRVASVDTLYPYPFGRFEGDLREHSVPLDGVDVAALRGWRRLAAAAEAIGTMESALDLTLDHVRTRVQFGRPIGSFQAVQHHLAEASALLHGARLLVYRAAVEGRDHFAEAATFTHEAASQVARDATQYHGALGQTLEYPLHLWVYRLRVLQSDLLAEA